MIREPFAEFCIFFHYFLQFECITAASSVYLCIPTKHRMLDKQEATAVAVI